MESYLRSRESAKVKSPGFPKPGQIESWRTTLISNLTEASAMTPAKTIKWINEIKTKNLQELEDSGGAMWERLDLKLGTTLANCVHQSPHTLKDDVDFQSQEALKKETILKGRQIAWMMIDFMKTNRTMDQVHTIDDLSRLAWLGDNKIKQFRDQWRMTVHNLRYKQFDPNMLRDMLYERIKVSKVLAPDIAHYERLNEDDRDKTHDWLIAQMDRHIAQQRLEEARRDEVATAKTGAPAQHNNKGNKKPKGEEKGSKGSGKKGKKGSERSQSASSKGSGKGGKGKGGKKGKAHDKGKSGTSSTGGLKKAADGSLLPCYYHLRGGCVQGDACPYAHIDASKVQPKGGKKGKGGSSSRSSSVGSYGSGKGGKKGKKGKQGKGKNSWESNALPNPRMPQVCKAYLSPSGCPRDPCPDIHADGAAAEHNAKALETYKKEMAKVRKTNSKTKTD